MPQKLHGFVQMNNVRTSIIFGSDTDAWETTLRAKPVQKRSNWVDYVGSSDSPAEMKRKLSAANWSFGDDKCDFKTAGSMIPPEGNILQYRGRLNKAVQEMIASSSFHVGSEKLDFKTTSRENSVLPEGEIIDYKGDHERAMAMKNTLSRSSLDLASDDPGSAADYMSTTHRR